MTYLLDTNVWIAYLGLNDPQLMKQLHQHAPADLALCSVVIGELLYGAFHGGPRQKTANLASVASIRQRFVSLAFDDRAAEEYGMLRHFLAARGTPIGPNDLMIAAIAKAHGQTVVTHNTVEFSRVPGLILEDWQTP